jgi:hypothetical protein
MKVVVGLFVAFICGLGVGLSFDKTPAPETVGISAPAEEVASTQPRVEKIQATVKPETITSTSDEPISRDSLNELIKLATQPEQQIVDPFSQLVEKISQDANARARVLQALKAERDPLKRAKLLSALSFVDTPDVVAAATEFITQNDSAIREDGYNLLRNAQLNSPAARAILLDSFTREENESALAAAISALVPESTPSTEDQVLIVSELNKLNQHVSPKVRGEVILAMSRWNPAAEQTGNMIQSALISSDADLRDSALTALVENPIRNEQIKTSLVNLLNNAQLDSFTRWRALDTVGSYNLTEKEKQTIALVRQSLPVPSEN